MDYLKTEEKYATVPYKILTDFNNIKEKKCKKIDISNNKLYKRLLDKSKSVSKTFDGTGLSMSLEVPPPPVPNNTERWLLWNKRNINRHVIPQSEAIILLFENGYKLNSHYEAYQAIDLANELRRKRGEKDVQETSLKEGNKFENVYHNKDTNIFRRRSMYGNKTFNNDLETFPSKKNLENKNEGKANKKIESNDNFSFINNSLMQNNYTNSQEIDELGNMNIFDKKIELYPTV